MNLRETFNRDGFAVLPGFYTEAEIDTAIRAVEACKRRRDDHVVIDFTDVPNGRRALLSTLTDREATERHFKINDLYLNSDAIRHLALNEAITPVLQDLLGTTPVLCNSLNMDYGTGQPPHVDALFMTPQTPGHLIAIWVALEDAVEEAGQLEYFPGSHLIPQYVFSSGSTHFEPSEMGLWESYMTDAVKRAGLERKRFGAKKGDLLIWHAYLLHGGTPIKNARRTRRSLVCHYYSKSDCLTMGVKLLPMNGAYWMDRPPAPVADIGQQEQFSESHYLELYPDVAEAVAAGAFRSGADHFEKHGRAEGRSPR